MTDDDTRGRAVRSSNEYAVTKEDETPAERGFVQGMVGILYLLFTVGCGIYYLAMLLPILSNDFYIEGVNSTGLQSAMIESYNYLLGSEQNGAVIADFTTVPGREADYSRLDTMIGLEPSYARMSGLAKMQGLNKELIWEIRNSTPHDVFEAPTQLCWLDLDRKFEMAHTTIRQGRCNDSMVTNGAVYLETFMRQFTWGAWDGTWGGPTGWFTSGVINQINTTEDGKAWMAYMQTNPGLLNDEKAELAHWKSKGIEKFEMSWTAFYQTGIDETIEIENALGMITSMTVKKYPSAKLSTVSRAFNLGVLDDFFFNNFMTSLNTPGWGSMIRDFPNHNGDRFFFFNSDPGAVAYETLIKNLGLLNCIDASAMQPTASISAVVSSAMAFLMQSLQENDDIYATYAGIPEATLSPIPQNWTTIPNVTYYMGDPMCSKSAQPKSFVHRSIGVDTTCEQQENRMHMTRKAMVFSWLAWLNSDIPDRLKDKSASDIVTSICNRCASAQILECNAAMRASYDVYQQIAAGNPEIIASLGVLAKQAVLDIGAQGINVEFIQVAGSNGTSDGYFLRQPLIDGEDKEWTFFGWAQMSEWVEGSREVVSLIGDTGKMNLMSYKYSQYSFNANSFDIPQSLGSYMLVSCMLTSLGFASALIIILLYALAQKFHGFSGYNLFSFNRVVASVYLGRSMLFIRGITAMLLISTASLQIVSKNGISSIQYNKRNVLESCLVAGEACWFVYMLNEIMLIFKPSRPLPKGLYGPISSAIVFLVCFFVDVIAPMEASVRIDQKCTSHDIKRREITCTGGRMKVGDINRMLTLVAVNFGTAVGVYFMLFIVSAITKGQNINYKTYSLLLPGVAADHFYDLNPQSKEANNKHIQNATQRRSSGYKANSKVSLDNLSAVMCGIYNIRTLRSTLIFDTKLWRSYSHKGSANEVHENSDNSGRSGLYICLHHTRFQVATHAADEKTKTTISKYSGTKKRIIAVLGMLYVAITLFAGYRYLDIADTNMSNNFFWAHFNSSGGHSFLGNIMNEQLYSNPDNKAIDLLSADYTTTADYSSKMGMINFMQSYPRLVQVYVEKDLELFIDGLRRMPGCDVPWLSTQFCWVDFDRKYPIAATQERQQRCEDSMKDNAAVYLEGVLRNMDWNDFERCWKDSWGIAFTELPVDYVTGLKDIASKAQAEKTEKSKVKSEAEYWKTKGLSRFTLQFHNHRLLGVTETFTITSAFGLKYPLTLKSSRSKHRKELRSTGRLYWNLASDLWAVMPNMTSISGRQLIRDLSNYAYQSISMEQVLIENGTVGAPGNPGEDHFRKVMGPYGTIDATIVTPADDLVDHSRGFREWLMARVKSNATLLEAMNNLTITTATITWLPHAWIVSNKTVGFSSRPSYTGEWLFIGGDMFCPSMTDLTREELKDGGDIPLYWTSETIPCGTRGRDMLPADLLDILYALVSAGIYTSDTDKVPTGGRLYTSHTEDDICSQNDLLRAVCPQMIQEAVEFLESSFNHKDLEVWYDKAQEIAKQLEPHNYSYIQMMENMNSGEVAFRSYNIYNQTEKASMFYGWIASVTWATQRRYMFHLEGDKGNMTFLGGEVPTVTLNPNPGEIPSNAAFFFLRAVQYITLVLISVAGAAVLYAIIDCGNISGLNMFEFNRVTGAVWVGRPLLLIRSITALCLLCTARLQLDKVNGLTYFTIKYLEWWEIVLASGEIGWVTYVIHDLFSVFTKDYTKLYAPLSTGVLWLIVSLLGIFDPVSHQASVKRVCEYERIDMQINCNSAIVEIGSPNQIIMLLVVTVITLLVVFAFVRLLFRNIKAMGVSSMFLSAGARYHYETDGWYIDGVHCVDKVSMLLNGTLVWQSKNEFLVFDVKTWRTYRVPQPESLRADKPDYISKALPLME